MKYKQRIIPEVNIPKEWDCISSNKLRNIMLNIARSYKGTSVKNKHIGINVSFTVANSKKVSKGGAVYKKKAALLFVLPQLIENAEYSNWGTRKPTDPSDVVGFLNFKAKCKIDGKIDNCRIAIQFRVGGKFFYNIEVNKKPSTKRTI